MSFSKNLLFILGILLISACKKGEHYDSSFPNTLTLISEQRDIEDVTLRYPFRVRMDDSFLYVMDLHASDYYCHQFHYPSMELKQSFAKRGRGPNEFLDAENIRLTKNSGCWVLDANNTKMARFHINGRDSLEKEIKLDKRLIRTLDFDLYNDTLMIVPDYTGMHRFDILFSDGTIKESRGSIPALKKDNNISDAAYAQAWRGFLDFNPQNGILAIATQLGEVIEIYDIPGDSLINVIYGKQGEPQFKYNGGYAIPTGLMGYSDVHVGKENIYALFWGHTFRDLKQETVKAEGGNKIQVFDLYGNPVKQYILDRYITGFFINEEKGILLGVDVNSDQPLIEVKINS